MRMKTIITTLLLMVSSVGFAQYRYVVTDSAQMAEYREK